MLPELERGVSDDAGLARLRVALDAGPWCWPSQERTTAFDLACTATGVSAPPEPDIGVIPGVTVDENCAHVWLIDASPRSRAAGDADLGDTCQQSWYAAAVALPRAVPLLWTSVSAAHSSPPQLRLLGTWLSVPGITATCRVVRGPSFGLAFLLVLASRVFGVRLPGDMIASAAITENGRVEPVEGIQLKIEAAIARMPQVRRLLVAAEQEQSARVWAAGRLSVIGVASASQALDVVFGNQLSELLLREGADVSRRRELAEWFFRFSLLGRGELVDWSPVAAAAKQALGAWPDLSEGQRFQLGFAQGVAERHEWNTGTLPVPSPDWLLARPVTMRTHLVAHLVQQVADVGQPSWTDIEPLVNLVRQPVLREAHLMQLRLEGALARLWAVSGRPLDALKHQEALAQACFDSLLYSEISFPLAEWLRLSGVVGDRDAFERAQEIRLAVETVGGFGLRGSVYVDLARSKAQALLFHGRYDLAATDLSRLATDPRAPEHVRWSAVRWVLRLEKDSVDPATLTRLARVLEQAAAQPDIRQNHAAAVNLALVGLDAALKSGAAAGGDLAVARLSELEPGLVANLRSAAPPSQVAAYVGLHYPY